MLTFVYFILDFDWVIALQTDTSPKSGNPAKFMLRLLYVLGSFTKNVTGSPTIYVLSYVTCIKSVPSTITC